jgi:Protein of unknown function (DUF1592)/Protein of unknown function (DUF1588)/Protein of unknown function (DUF1587)/Protein of unknown function (DUF1585)/Protein of unknown function (DUF1595)/Planctomycete cytochrome C
VAVVGRTPEEAPRTDPVTVATADKPSFDKHVRPVLTAHCIACHGSEKPKAGLNLDKYKDEAAAQADQAVWEKVAHNLRSGEMPPKDKPRLKPADLERVGQWIEMQLARVDCGLKHDPGRVTVRRLNRAEYNNTIRDLVGIDFHPAENFPADDSSHGFDNIGEVLSLPPLLMEKYLAAAEKIVEMAWKNPQAKQRILFIKLDAKNKADAGRQIIERFATQAYRRPVSADEVKRLMRFVELAEKQGGDAEKGIQLAVQAALVSPHFLFRIERGPDPRNPDSQRIGEYDLASRLSYFLWSSMPDAQLFRLASTGNLHAELEPQIRRMLNDPKANGLVVNFAGQWLQLRNLAAVTPDPDRFPSFDEPLRDAMRKETEMFFAAVLKEDRSVLDFIDGRFTFLNERLAKHYGINDVKGDRFRKVELTGNQRGGVLTHASVLTVTSNPTRTSPVKRGKWILENILGTPPPPPPPDAGDLPEDKKGALTGTLRQKMEQHRTNPNCASCHQRMDPLGFGFENFDAVGAWRTQEDRFPIDASGILPDGRSFRGPTELKVILKEKADLFAHCLSEKMLTYALGRGLERQDRCAVDEVAAFLKKNDYKFSALVLGIVKSEPFQNRPAKQGGKK